MVPSGSLMSVLQLGAKAGLHVLDILLAEPAARLFGLRQAGGLAFVCQLVDAGYLFSLVIEVFLRLWYNKMNSTSQSRYRSTAPLAREPLAKRYKCQSLPALEQQRRPPPAAETGSRCWGDMEARTRAAGVTERLINSSIAKDFSYVKPTQFFTADGRSVESPGRHRPGCCSMPAAAPVPAPCWSGCAGISTSPCSTTTPIHGPPKNTTRRGEELERFVAPPTRWG